MRYRLVAALTLALATSSACKKEQKSDTGTTGTSTASADPASEAKAIFRMKCVVCHGETGEGTGPGAAALNPKPQNYTDPAWQAKVTDDEIKKAILEGGAAVGKNPAMPPNPDLKSKPQVVDELLKIVRGFKK